jgi:hypothetical protein
MSSSCVLVAADYTDSVFTVGMCLYAIRRPASHWACLRSLLNAMVRFCAFVRLVATDCAARIAAWVCLHDVHLSVQALRVEGSTRLAFRLCAVVPFFSLVSQAPLKKCICRLAWSAGFL